LAHKVLFTLLAGPHGCARHVGRSPAALAQEKGGPLDILTITLLVLAVLALSGWGYGYYAARPAPGTVVELAPAPAPGLTLLGIIGLILLVAFVVLLLTGWRFGLEVHPPW
jgi:hypothetical protein